LKPAHRSGVATNGTHLFVVDGQDLHGHIQVWNVRRNVWTLLEHMLKTPRQGATATIINGRLYVTGGHGWYRRRTDDRDPFGLHQAPHSLSYVPSTEVFDVTDGSSCCCTPVRDHGVPDLEEARGFHASVTRSDTIYIIGGKSEEETSPIDVADSVLSSCECLNVSTRTSARLPSLRQGRYDLAAVLWGCDDGILAIGGIGPGQAVDPIDVESYNFETQQWSALRSMTMTAPRYGHCAVVCNKNKLFVIGGWSGKGYVNNVEVFDPENEKWEIQSTLSTPVFASSALKL